MFCDVNLCRVEYKLVGHFRVYINSTIMTSIKHASVFYYFYFLLFGKKYLMVKS